MGDHLGQQAPADRGSLPYPAAWEERHGERERFSEL